MNRGYIRVSTARQQAEGLSLEAQKKAIRDYLKGKEVKFYKDVGTGRNGNRKQLKKMMKDLQKEDKVIVFKLDRISRSTIDLANLVRTFQRKKVVFVSTRESIDVSTASGKLFVGMLGLFAEFESDLISERTLNSISLAKARGRWLGGKIPYGWSRQQGQLSPVPEEQRIIEQMTKWREIDKWSYDKIATTLTNNLVKTKQNSGKWWGDNVNHIIARNRELKELLRPKV